jgi:cardiolipin synthase
MKTVHLSPDHAVRLLHGGADFFPALIEAIDASQTEIRLETYIFNFDATGESVANALIRAAQRRVSVLVMVDGIGTPPLTDRWSQRLEEAGVQWHRFLPLGWIGVVLPLRWRRLHRKLCVVDGIHVFCGGINVIDDCVDLNHGALSSPRFDFAVKVTGPLVKEAHSTLEQFWLHVKVGQQMEHLQWKKLGQTFKQVLSQRSAASALRKADHSQGAVWAALVLRDNLFHRSSIERTYRKAIGEAREDVLIASAYFLPGRKLRNALIHAAKRGVRVRLLLQGRYEYFIQLHGARMVYGALLDAGVEIYEYTAGYLHAKVAVVDGHWATVGSSNLDPLSMLLAHEANVVVEDAAFALALQAGVLRALDQQSVRVDPQGYKQRAWHARLLDRVALGLVRLVLFLMGSRY